MTNISTSTATNPIANQYGKDDLSLKDHTNEVYEDASMQNQIDEVYKDLAAREQNSISSEENLQIKNDKPAESKDYSQKGFITKVWNYLVNNDYDAYFGLSKQARKTIDYLFKKMPSQASWLCAAANFVGGLLLQANFSKATKDTIEKFTKWMTNITFFPYGIAGGINAFQTKDFCKLAFWVEPLAVAFGNTETTYLRRRAWTATDQIPYSIENKLRKEGIVDEAGKFKTWSDSLVNIPKMFVKSLTEFITKPSTWLKPDGHYVALSSFGGLISGLGFMITGIEKGFGEIGNIAASAIDAELLFAPGKKLVERLSGLGFVLESICDFIGRKNTGFKRLLWNHGSIGFGRLGLELYQSLYKGSQRTKEEKLKAAYLASKGVTEEQMNAIAEGKEVKANPIPRLHDAETIQRNEEMSDALEDGANNFESFRPRIVRDDEQEMRQAA